MRSKGTIYEEIKTLPKKAIPVSKYAADNAIAVGQVYIKYTRHTKGYKNGTKAPYPGYVIRQFQGMNFVIPD